MHEKVALEHSSKSTKYELESSYGDLVHEQFHSFNNFLLRFPASGASQLDLPRFLMNFPPPRAPNSLRGPVLCHFPGKNPGNPKDPGNPGNPGNPGELNDNANLYCLLVEF